MSEEKRYRVRGPHGAVAVVRVGGTRGMDARTWKRRKAAGELVVIEEVADVPTASGSRRRGRPKKVESEPAPVEPSTDDDE